ncbi:MAG TPA: CHAT domain-containing protein, partial [Anaerolineae bacterium]|nr:CHAT domain-containing protein [Anaerolineae bacterium]
KMRGTLQREALRVSFLQGKLTAYHALLGIYLDRGDTQAAFAMAERAKSRTLADVISGSVERRLQATLSAEQHQRLATLRADLDALYNQLLDPTESDRGSHQRLHAQAIVLEREIAGLQGFDSPALRDATQIQTQLPTNLPLVIYHLLDDEWLAFVYHADQLQVVRQLGDRQTVHNLLTQLKSQWDRLRLGRAFITPHLARFERSAKRVLAQLYTTLFAPLLDYLPTSGDLVIVPHGELHSFPFHALHDGQHYLIDQFTISYAPSATVLGLCEQQPYMRGGIVGVGSDSLGLAAVSAELTALQNQFPSATIYARNAATIEQVQQKTPQHGLLHIATHGLFRADNPLFSALKLHDGWLTTRDIQKIQHVPTHVTLSACDSGRSSVMAGDETFGLSRAFLSIGVASLLVTQWLVQDEIAAALMKIWYAELDAGCNSADALRIAQIAIRDRFPHPYYWAPFVLIGRRHLSPTLTD